MAQLEQKLRHLGGWLVGRDVGNNMDDLMAGVWICRRVTKE